MKKIYLLCFVFLFSFLTSMAQVSQNPCGTEHPSQQHLSYLEYIMANRSDFGVEVTDTIIYIPIKFHFVYDANRNVASESELLDVLCELNQKYKPAKIYFYMKEGVEYIQDFSFNPLGSFGNGSNLMLQYNIARAVNVYYTNLGSMGLCGYATFPGTGPGTTLKQGGMVLGTNGGCSARGNSTFAHEMGHYLSLPHPFETTSNNPADAATAERVTRNFNEVLPRLKANCNTAGDRFCDTEADNLGYRWNCFQPVPVATDINGDTLRPDPTLYMGYSLDACANRFSPQQIAAMRTTMQTVRAYLTRPSISSPDTVNDPQNLISPANNDTGIVSNFAYFKWNRVPKASLYSFQLSRSPNFNTLVLDTILSDTAFLYVNNGMQAMTTYRWRVKPYNYTYTCAPPSATYSFKTTFPFGVGVSQINDNNLILYPTLLDNGSSIRIINQGLTQEPLSVKITDVNGKMILQRVFESNQGSIDFPVEVQSAGLYFVHIESGSVYTTRKLVVR